MFSWELLILIIMYGIMLFAYYCCSRVSHCKNVCKIDLMIATFKKSDIESLIEKIKRLEQEKSYYSKIFSKGGYNANFFGIIAALLAGVVFAGWSIGVEGKNAESRIFFSIAPLFLIAFIEIINTIYQKNKEEIEEKIQSEIDKTKHQLYQHFYNKQQNLTIKLPDDDSVLKVEKILTSDQKLQINTYVWNRIIKK